MRIARQKADKWKPASTLFRLTRRTVLFLYLFLCVLVLFFAVGNYQRFLDSNLQMIVKSAAASAYALACFSFAGLLECAALLFLEKSAESRRFYAVHGILMILSAATGAIFLAFFHILDLLSVGFP